MADQALNLLVSPHVKEEWRTVPGSEGLYSVSNYGRVRSEPVNNPRKGRQRGRVLNCYRDSKGYLQFGMSIGSGRPLRMKVHRAVALAFLGPRPEGDQINHKSGDKSDNSVSNLEYVTCLQNIRHAWQTGLQGTEHRSGERNNMAKLTVEDVRQIRAMAGTQSNAELARRFGVTTTNIGYVIKGITWKQVA